MSRVYKPPISEITDEIEGIRYMFDEDVKETDGTPTPISYLSKITRFSTLIDVK